MDYVQDSTAISAELEAELTEHFSKIISEPDRIRIMRNEYHKAGHLNFTGYSFLPKNVMISLHEEVLYLIEKNSIRRDVIVPSTGSTPRKMYNVNQPEIKRDGVLIDLLYRSEALRSFLGLIARDELTSCWEQEEYLITKLTHPGDTHGWHWGDYPYTLIWIIEAPKDPSIGGVLQCVPNTEWNKNDPKVWEYIIENDIKSYHHQKGDVYFLKSDTTLHHVTPIQKETLRIILNTCWASKYDRRDNIEHESIDIIWGQEARD
jgi:hypothetical protein